MEEVVLKVKVEGGGEATNTVKSLKQELRDAKRAAEQAAEGTDEYFAAIRRAAGAKDKLEDINKAVTALNPGDKAAAFGQLFNTIAGGFQTVTGLYGLFGAKSEDVEKILLRVQSASALAMGIQSIVEGVKQWNNLKAVIVSTTAYQVINNATTGAATAIMGAFGIAVDATSISFKVLKTAIAATGIGLLVVVVGELVSQMSSLTDANEETANSQNKVTKEFEDTARTLTLLNSIVEDYYRLQLELSNARGDSLAEIQQKERDLLKAQQDSAEANVKLLKKQIDDLDNIRKGIKQFYGETAVQYTDLEDQYSALSDKYTKAYSDLYNFEIRWKILNENQAKNIAEANKKRKDEIQKQIDADTEYYLWKVGQEKKSQELVNKELELLTKYGISQEEINNEWQQSTIDDYGAFLDDLGKRRAEYFNQVQADYLNTVATQDLLDQNRLLDEQLMADFQLTQDNIDLKYQDWQTKHKGSYADFMSWLRGSLQEERDLNIENAESIRQARLQMAQSTLNGLISLGELFINDEKKRVKFQKVATVAQLALDTASAISTTIANATKAASAGGPAAPFLQASYIASGIAQVLASFLAAKKALTDSSLSQIAGGGGGGSTSFSAPSINTPTNQQSFTTPGTDAQGNYKIFVTESDISNTQQLVAGNLKKALLG